MEYNKYIFHANKRNSGSENTRQLLAILIEEEYDMAINEKLYILDNDPRTQSYEKSYSRS